MANLTKNTQIKREKKDLINMLPNSSINTYISYNIMLLPPKKLSDDISVMSSFVRKTYSMHKDPMPWIPHISLAYSDDMIKMDELIEIISKLKIKCKKILPFEAKINNFGSFDKNRLGYPVYLRVENHNSLRRLHKIASSASKQKYKKYPNFIPHVTIAYYKKPFKDLDNKIKELNIAGFVKKFRVNSIFIGVKIKDSDPWKLTTIKLKRELRNT